MRIEIACVTSPAHVAMLDKGDLDGYAVWRRVLRAVEELQRAELGRAGRCTDRPLPTWHRVAPLRRAALPPSTPRARSWTCEWRFNYI